MMEKIYNLWMGKTPSGTWVIYRGAQIIHEESNHRVALAYLNLERSNAALIEAFDELETLIEQLLPEND